MPINEWFMICVGIAAVITCLAIYANWKDDE